MFKSMPAEIATGRARGKAVFSRDFWHFLIFALRGCQLAASRGFPRNWLPLPSKCQSWPAGKRLARCLSRTVWPASRRRIRGGKSGKQGRRATRGLLSTWGLGGNPGDIFPSSGYSRLLVSRGRSAASERQREGLAVVRRPATSSRQSGEDTARRERIGA